jgi:GNAT superfamily N-acetyltransferase
VTGSRGSPEPGRIRVMDWIHGEYAISDDPERVDRDAVRRFLADSYWASERSGDVIDRSLDHSLTFSLFHGGQQVGMARAITDQATVAWLCDVYIEPAHRGGGLGEWLVSVVVDHPELQGLRRWLLATSYSHSLYARAGFTELPEPGRFMIRHGGP